jgi:hypothetical protein
LAEEAVISEPVSARWFPVPRENTGKFADFGLEIAKAPRLSEENSTAYQQNSLVAKAGKICGRSGKPEAGNSESDLNNRVSSVVSRGLLFFKSTTIWNEHSAAILLPRWWRHHYSW